MKQAPAPLPGTVRDPRFPDTDENGRGANDFHTRAVFDLREALVIFFASQADVYVTCNLPLCHQKGRPVCRIDPDVMAAKRAGAYPRRCWSIRDEKRAPDVIIEVVSAETWRYDLSAKRRVYERLGVKEYFLFDPEAEFLHPPVVGFRLRHGAFRPLKHAVDGGLTSRELGVRLVPEGVLLRLIDRNTGEPLLTWAERIEREERRAEQAKQQADEAMRLRRLRTRRRRAP